MTEDGTMSEDVNRLMSTVSKAAGRRLDPDVWEDRQIIQKTVR